MPASQPTLELHPAVRRPHCRRELAVAATVLCASASGGVLVALLKPPRAKAPPVLALPVPTAIAVPTAEPAEPPARLPSSLFDVAPVIAQGGLRVVVATEVEPQWLGDSIRVSDHQGVRVVVRSLSQRGEQRFAGRVAPVLRLHGRESRLCTAEVTGLVAVGRFAPEDFEAGDPPADAAAAWKAAEGGQLIAADLVPIEGDCAGALWAQPDGPAEPVRATITAASAAQKRLASELLESSSRYKEVAETGSKIELEATIITTESEELLVASALSEGCVGFEPFMTAIYALQADGSLHPVANDLRVPSIEAAADLDGDGHVEILFRSDDDQLAILRRRSGGYQVEAHAALPIYGCRC